MTMTEQFLADIEAFLERHHMSESAFGVKVLNDSKFIPDVRRGRAPSLRLVERVKAFMAEAETAA